MLGRYARSFRPVGDYLSKYLPAESLRGLNPRLNWGLILAIQLNPAIPASSAGYAFGMSGVPYGTFGLASTLATLPMQIILVTISAVGINAVTADKITGYAFTAFLCASAALAVMTFLRLRRSRQSEIKVETDANSE
jgi:uncharacterized membrane protein YdjX (TVP38/TMEM64 family)